MFSQIQVEIVKAQPILFGKVRLELRLHVPEPAVANYVDGFKVRYRLLSSVRECSQTVNTPEQRSLYCSLTEDLRQLELLPDESDWQESLLPGRETGPSNLTAGVIDVRTPLSADVSLVKSMLTGLTPFSCYQLSAEAYSRVTAVTSRESPPARLLTLEDIPGRAPHNVRSFWTRQSGVNMLSLQWQLPPRYSWHGRILGVVVHLFANTSRLLLSSRRHNVSQRLLLLPGLDPVHSYSLHLSLYNCRGEGSRSPRIHIPASTTSSPGSGSLYEHQPWFVPLVVLATLFFWLLLCGLVVYLCCARCRSGGHDPASKFGKSHAPPPLPLYSHPQYHLEPLIKEVSVPSAAANTSSANNTGNHKSDALYSATSLVTSGSCTPYASASIIDAPSDTLNNTVLNNNGNSINTKFFTATSMDELNPGQLPGMPPYLTYAPYSHMSISSGPLLPYPPPPPPILPVVSTATAALAKDDPSGQKMIPGGAAGWPGGTVKMGLGHLPGSSSGASSSGGSGCARRHNGAATSSSNNSQQHQHPGNGTAALATMGSTPPACASSDWSLTAEGRDEASSKGRKSMGEESPKSTVHYDVIPNRDTEDDDSNDDSNDEDDCATSQTSTENNQYDLGSPPLGPDCSTTVPHQLQQHQPPGYSSDSVTYLSLPQKRRPPHKKKHLRQGNSTKIGATCFQKSKL